MICEAPAFVPAPIAEYPTGMAFGPMTLVTSIPPMYILSEVLPPWIAGVGQDSPLGIGEVLMNWVEPRIVGVGHDSPLGILVGKMSVVKATSGVGQRSPLGIFAAGAMVC